MKKTPFALPSALALALLATPLASFATPPAAQSKHPTPPEVWKDYDPAAGDFKEEIISEETKDGIYYKDSYISAYVNGEEVRVYCKYAVKADAKNAPGLMNVHGWYAFPRLDMGLVNVVTSVTELEEVTVQWCHEMLANSPTALRALKAALNADCDGQAGLQELAGIATMLYYMSDEAKEGRDAQLTKRKADFRKFAP
jgi:hypothetical protein